MFKRVIQKLKIIFVPSEENGYRPKFLESRVLLWCLLALFVLKLFTIPFLITFPKTIFFSAIVKTTLIESLNQERQFLQLRPLKENPQLERAAFWKAQDILEKDYFSHQSPEGVSPWFWIKKAGYNYTAAGENLAIGFLDSEEVHQSWMASPSHRANLLNPNYQEVGIAIAKGDFQGKEVAVVVQLFGVPKKTVSGPKEETKEEIKEEVKKAEITKKEKIEEMGKKGMEELEGVEGVKKAKEVKEMEGTGKAEGVEEEILLTEDISKEKKEAAPFLEETQEKVVLNLFSFFASDYHKVLQIVIYGFLGLIILSLLINIFVRFDIQHPDLILKTVGFIAVLLLFILIDKEIIIKFIPHNFGI